MHVTATCRSGEVPQKGQCRHQARRERLPCGFVLLVQFIDSEIESSMSKGEFAWSDECWTAAC